MNWHKKCRGCVYDAHGTGCVYDAHGTGRVYDARVNQTMMIHSGAINRARTVGVVNVARTSFAKISAIPSWYAHFFFSCIVAINGEKACGSPFNAASSFALAGIPSDCRACAYASGSKRQGWQRSG